MFAHQYYARLGMKPQRIAKSLHLTFDRLLAIAHLRFQSETKVMCLHWAWSCNCWCNANGPKGQHLAWCGNLPSSQCMCRSMWPESERQHLAWHDKLPSPQNIISHLFVRKSASKYTTRLSNPTHDVHFINIHASCTPYAENNKYLNKLYECKHVYSKALLSKT